MKRESAITFYGTVVIPAYVEKYTSGVLNFSKPRLMKQHTSIFADPVSRAQVTGHAEFSTERLTVALALTLTLTLNLNLTITLTLSYP